MEAIARSPYTQTVLWYEKNMPAYKQSRTYLTKSEQRYQIHLKTRLQDGAKHLDGFLYLRRKCKK